MDLKQVLVQPVRQFKEKYHQELLQEYHCLDSLPKISETLWYIATWLNNDKKRLRHQLCLKSVEQIY